MPSLIVFPKPGLKTGFYNLYRRLTSIGRDPDSDVVVNEPSVEPCHAQISFDGKVFVLSPVEGQVYVNGKKTKKHALRDQDVIRLGSCTLMFSIHDVPETDEMARSGVGSREILRKLYEFTTALMEQRDIQVLIDIMLDKLMEITGADKGFLFLVENGLPTLQAARNISSSSINLRETAFSDSIVRTVVETKKPLLISDAMADTHFKMSQSVLSLRLCSVMCAPVVFQTQLLGVIYLGNDNIVNLFNADALDTLQVFAGQAGLLIRNAQLINDLWLRKQHLEDEIERLKLGQLIGASQVMREVFKRVRKVAGTDINVLVVGETGSGKELVAREIHRHSERSSGPFVAINCGAIPDTLLESELFGHEKGAFTGAHASRIGKFQAANRGTLFLDEIGDMPVSLQPKLLRAIETKQIVRVGSTKTEAVDIRIVAATNKDLEAEVAAGRFRQDLYYRLNVVTIRLPPLRERGDDVTLLARYFLQRFGKEYGKNISGFSTQALSAMQLYSWPGNVRELENRIRKAVILAEGPLVHIQDLELPEEEFRVLPLVEAKERFQREYILKVLRITGGNKTRTAKLLGVDPRTIFRYLEKERE